jgi:hypothetical protein
MRAISYILLIIGTYYAGARTAQLLCETRYVIFCPAEMQLPESVIADYPHNRRTLGKPVQHVSCPSSKTERPRGGPRRVGEPGGYRTHDPLIKSQTFMCFTRIQDFSCGNQTHRKR